MIRFTLKCDNDHQFDGWFKSSEGFETLHAAGHVTCSICGSTAVSKSLMAPSVTPARSKTALSHPGSDVEKALQKMRAEVEANSDDVGQNFATEARKMHDGEVPERSIYGTAKLEDAKKLVEDGVPVAPLPFMPKRQVN